MGREEGRGWGEEKGDGERGKEKGWGGVWGNTTSFFGKAKRLTLLRTSFIVIIITVLNNCSFIVQLTAPLHYTPFNFEWLCSPNYRFFVFFYWLLFTLFLLIFQIGYAQLIISKFSIFTYSLSIQNLHTTTTTLLKWSKCIYLIFFSKSISFILIFNYVCNLI